jgi:hypothetical protein
VALDDDVGEKVGDRLVSVARANRFVFVIRANARIHFDFVFHVQEQQQNGYLAALALRVVPSERSARSALVQLSLE